MKNKKNLLILGYFGYVNNQLDGQTVRTRSIYRLVAEKLKNYNIIIYDTQELQSSKLSIIRLIFHCIKANKIFYIPAQNNLKLFFLPLFLFSAILNINLYYFAIGGWLPEFIHRRSLIRKAMSKLKVIFVQNKAVKQRLMEQHGFNNVSILPNFRITDFEPSILKNDIDKSDLKVVFMGRITKLKGVDTIFRLAEHIQESLATHPFSIDFYGPINQKETTWFYFNVNRFSFVNYRGILEPEDIYEKLSKYDVLILPTKYPGEGFPGSILDAYISGIPVIVSNHKYLSECVDEGESGFLIDVDDDEKLFNYLEWFYFNPKKLSDMKYYAYSKSKHYSPEAAWKEISNYL